MRLYELLESLSKLTALEKLVMQNKQYNSVVIQNQLKHINGNFIDVFEDIVSGSNYEIDKWINHISETGKIASFIRYIYDNQYIDDTENNLDFDEHSGKLVMQNGKLPKFVYRIVEPSDWNQDAEYLLPSPFYKRIHASSKPELKYGKTGDLILQIRYSESDEWHPKRALGGQLYAVTYNKISKHKIKII